MRKVNRDVISITRVLGKRELTVKFSTDGWANVRSALIDPVRSKPGSFRKYSRQVRNQGYNLDEGRWASNNTPLSDAEKRTALTIIRSNIRAKVAV